jgi:hypothetical protein
MFARGETVSQAPTATMNAEVSISSQVARLSINGILPIVHWRGLVSQSAEQAINEPPEANRYLWELPARLRRDAINHLAAHHRFTDRCFLAPLRLVLEEVEDGDGKVIAGWQQSRASGDDSELVMVSVTGEGKVRAVLHPFQVERTLTNIPGSTGFSARGPAFMTFWSSFAFQVRNFGQTATLTLRAAELRGEKCLHQFPSECVTDYEAPEADHVQIVVLDALVR